MSGAAALLLLLLSISARLTRASGTIPAPFFKDGDNLSVNNCWNRTGHEFPKWEWAAYVIGQRGGCFGIVISQWTILSSNCDAINETEGDLRIKIGDCVFDVNAAPQYCVQRIQVERVAILDLKRSCNTLNATLTLFTTKQKLPPKAVPVCLFNRGSSQHQLNSSDNYHSFQAFHESTRTITRRLSGACAPVISDKTHECARPESSDQPIYSILRTNCNNPERAAVALLNYHEGRNYLRGISLKHYPKSNNNTFIDILPHVHWIARNSKGISLLPLSQPVKQIKTFSASDNLSFSNCGRKATGRTRNKRNEDGSFEELPPVHHIFSGFKAQQHGHPWHAFLKNFAVNSECGGTLISPRTVLTAAHCIYEAFASDIDVSVGMYQRNSNDSSIQTRTASRVITHVNYTGQFQFDIGLLIFDDPFVITAHVRPICLWNEDTNLDKVANKLAVVVGYGLVDNYTKTDTLQEARLLIRTNKDCFLNHRGFFGLHLRPGDNFCAGFTNGTSTCDGDSGSSLSVEINGRWFIRGVVSYGPGKKAVGIESVAKEYVCNPKYYSLFTDVASHMDWVVENTPDVSFRTFSR